MLAWTHGKQTIIRELKHVSLPRSAATPQRHQQPVYTRVDSHVVSVGIVIDYSTVEVTEERWLDLWQGPGYF